MLFLRVRYNNSTRVQMFMNGECSISLNTMGRLDAIDAVSKIGFRHGNVGRILGASSDLLLTARQHRLTNQVLTREVFFTSRKLTVLLGKSLVGSPLFVCRKRALSSIHARQPHPSQKQSAAIDSRLFAAVAERNPGSGAGLTLWLDTVGMASGLLDGRTGLRAGLPPDRRCVRLAGEPLGTTGRQPLFQNPARSGCLTTDSDRSH